MKMRGLMVATVVLALLAGALYWSNHRKPTPSADAATANTKLLTLKEADLVRLELKKKDTDPVVLVRDAGNQWQITAPKPYPVDQEVAGAITGALTSLDAERVVEDKPADLTTYGLAQPALELDTTAKDGKTHKLLFGDETPTGNAFFAQLDGNPRVVTISGYNKGLIDKSLVDLRDRRLLPLDSTKVSRLEVKTGKQDLEFGRSQDSWQILKPQPMRADSSKVTDLLNKMIDAKMELSGAPDEDKKSATAFAAAKPIGVVRLTDPSGEKQLEVRKNKDDYYVKSSAVAGVYRVLNDVGDALTKTLDDYRNKSLFDFGYNQADKIELRDGAKSYLLNKSGSDWMLAGKKVDSGGVEDLEEKIRTLEASKFVDSGFAKPAIELAVTSANGKSTEKVSIAKAGANYVAKRGDEPTLYQLDAASITSLEKAASDLAPAPSQSASAQKPAASSSAK